MPQLIIEQPGAPVMVAPLIREITSVGRAEDNDIVLVADEVSRHHATIRLEAGQAILADCKSLNGTYVNRQRIIERVLAHNDEIWFGSKCRAIFDEASPTPVDEKLQRLADGTSLSDHLDRIRDDMDRLSNNMTMLGKSGFTNHSTSTLIHATEKDVVAMGRAFRRLSAMYKASRQASALIASRASLSERLAAVLDTAMEVTEAERGFVMLKSDRSGDLEVHVAREMGQELRSSSPSMGIAEQAVLTGEPVIMRDCRDDTQFGGRESIIFQKIHSAMCVPLKIEDRILGSIYVDTRRMDHMFSESDLELFSSVASQSAMAIENAQLADKMIEAERKRVNLGRFLSPAIVERIMSEDKELELGGHRQTVTTLFSDIRGFTPIAEHTEASILVDMLNEHFTAMVQIIFAFQGTLDKYIGDGLMAVFGAPVPMPDDARKAIAAALAMQRKNAELNVKRAILGRPQLDMGIGICSGEVIAGYIGAPERMEFTVIGDRVNVASRLCAIANSQQVLIDEGAFAKVEKTVNADSIGAVKLKGREKPVLAYQVYGFKSGV